MFLSTHTREHSPHGEMWVLRRVSTSSRRMRTKNRARGVETRERMLPASFFLSAQPEREGAGACWLRDAEQKGLMEITIERKEREKKRKEVNRKRRRIEGKKMKERERRRNGSGEKGKTRKGVGKGNKIREKRNTKRRENEGGMMRGEKAETRRAGRSQGKRE